MKFNQNSRLYQEFIQKVKEFYRDEFCKSPEYAADFEKDRIKDLFGRLLKEHLEKDTGIKNPFNHRTLINIVNGGIAPNARQTTLDAIAKFCGYDNYASFLENNPTVIKPKRKLYVLWITAVVLLTGLLVWWTTDKPNREIHRIIHDANRAQFNAYKALPEVKTNGLKPYYTENGSAFKVIEDILKRSATLNRVITQPETNSSYYTIHEIKILKKERGRLIAETQEHWYLRWYCLNTQKFVKKYDETNSQIYVFKKEQGKWKIDSNDYKGTAENIED